MPRKRLPWLPVRRNHVLWRNPATCPALPRVLGRGPYFGEVMRNLFEDLLYFELFDQKIRCGCGRWADSDGRGQCWICFQRGGSPFSACDPWTDKLFVLLLLPLGAALVGLAKAYKE